MNTSLVQPALGDRVLARGKAENHYAARLASSVEDVRAAQTLRFLVFNLELNEGLEQSFATLRDADPFDEICDHLLVEDRRTGEVVGTYRLQTGLVAAQNLGYYSAQEFDLSPFEGLRPQVIELGRACVHSQHRNLTVLSLLWKGIASYARARGGRYLTGCSSLSSQDAAVGGGGVFGFVASLPDRRTAADSTAAGAGLSAGHAGGQLSAPAQVIVGVPVVRGEDLRGAGD